MSIQKLYIDRQVADSPQVRLIAERLDLAGEIVVDDGLDLHPGRRQFRADRAVDAAGRYHWSGPGHRCRGWSDER